MSAKENPPSSDAGDGRKGLSKEAWVAISTIAAALITGIVTLIIHLAPQKPSSNPGPTASPTAVTSTPSQTPVGITADTIAGKWGGRATDSAGKSFEITLEIRKSCTINERCGTISVSHVPCYGEVFLHTARDQDFEFRVDNFYGQSNREQCQAGPGEHFHLRPDGKLDYSTTYQPEAEGLLERQGD
jgi:hypothetical protein